MKKISIVIFLVLASILLAQNSVITGQEARFYNAAKKFYNDGDYVKALNQIQIASDDVKQQAEYHRLLGQIYVALQNFELARDEFEIYKKGSATDTRSVNKIIKILDDAINVDEEEVKVIKSLSHLLGDINTNSSEFAPVIDSNRNGMYYSSRKPSQYAKLNVWYADFSNGVWVNSRTIDGLSANLNESVGGFSSDGNTAYLFGNFYGANEGDLFFSTKQDDRWSRPNAITAINSESTEMQPFIYQDNVMFFVSNRPGGFGGFDIYVSEYNRGWSNPVNLGPVINTVYYEETPFFDWDGKTLYFSSNGHPGLGEFDIFKSTKIGESWQDWSEPENMGVVINSVRNDYYFTHAKNDNNWYLASDRVGGKGFDDIYKINIFKNPDYDDDFTEIYGIVLDKESNDPISGVQVLIEAFSTGNRREAVTDEEGKYSIKTEAQESYRFDLNIEGYNAYSKKVVLANEDEFEQNFSLKKTVGIIEIEDIYFDFNKTTLREESFPALDLLLRTLQINLSKSAEIRGHTDNKGSDKYNLKLSQERAQSVVDYLISNGINKNRLISKGFGESMPIDTNDTEEGRQANRRVEMKVN